MKSIFITTAALFAFGILSAQTDTTAVKKSSKSMTKSTTQKNDMSTKQKTGDTPGAQENPGNKSKRKRNTTVPSGSAHGATGRENGTGLPRNESGNSGGNNVDSTASKKKS